MSQERCVQAATLSWGVGYTIGDPPVCPDHGVQMERIEGADPVAEVEENRDAVGRMVATEAGYAHYRCPEPLSEQERKRRQDAEDALIEQEVQRRVVEQERERKIAARVDELLGKPRGA